MYAFLTAVLLFQPVVIALQPVPVIVSTVAHFTINNPSDVTVDGSGNVLYVSYTYHSVYRLLTSGATLLVAGSGSSSGSGMADDPGTAATFYNPTGITCDTSNNIAYISDYGNHRIRRLNLSTITNTVTTLAGNTYGHADGVGSAAKFRNLWGIVYHKSGVLYVTDNNNNNNNNNNARIRRIIVATAAVTTVATQLPGTYGYNLCITNNGTFLYVTT
jgi:hypothetical protein